MCFCLGFKPITKVDTHTHTRLTRPYYVHTQIPRAILVYMEHTREMHTRIFSHNKKNGGQNKNVILTKTRRKKALRFRRRRRKKKVFFGCQNNRMNKSRGLTSFRPSSWLQRVCSGLPFSWQQARLLLYFAPFARFYFLFSWTAVRFCGGEAISTLK